MGAPEIKSSLFIRCFSSKFKNFWFGQENGPNQPFLVQNHEGPWGGNKFGFSKNVFRKSGWHMLSINQGIPGLAHLAPAFALELNPTRVVAGFVHRLNQDYKTGCIISLGAMLATFSLHAFGCFFNFEIFFCLKDSYTNYYF